jgi:hypothetical protein|tara:strand:- start:585 stop:2942 length:2358 start_codon:yes stop_codon:yes gene_type:complete
MKSKNTIAVIILIVAMSYSNLSWTQDQMTGKLMMGYQGWFLTKGDNSGPNQWRHWFRSTVTPSAQNFTIDMWPDMSEYTQRYDTDMTYSDGSNAQLFSSHDLSTTRKHFEWMKDYNIHGVHLQRFLGEIQDSQFFSARNNVLQNVMTSAAEYDRHFSVMYDLSGVPDNGTLYNNLIEDWEFLVDTYDILNAEGYVKEDGRPVVALWGIGFKDRGLTIATFEAIIDYFHNTADPKYRAYIMGGVPDGWRTLSGSSETGIGWKDIYNSLDMISPWSVGRYSSENGIDNWKNSKIAPDLATCNANDVDYMPVIWPGFSWLNLHDGPLNQISRDEGNFYWRQAYNAISAGVKYIYVAMFDEVDEATAMFKIAETKSQLPVEGQDILVPLDIDGASLPSDWYLQLADQTQQMLDGYIPLTSVIPITPVTGEGNGSEFVTQQDLPFTMELNETVTVSVTLKNVGTITWTKASGYFLGSQNPQDNTTWGLNRVSLGDDDNILPNEEKTFEFDITAPTIAGNINFQWRMLQDGVEWFGAYTLNEIIVVGGGGNYLDDCDSTSDWNPEILSLNTADKIQGIGCLEFASSSADEFFKVFTSPYNSNGDESNTVLQFWYYVSDISLLSEANQVEIGSSGKPDANEYSWSLDGLKNGWNFIRLNTSDAGKIGNPDLSAINWFRLYRFKTGSVTNRVDAIELLGGTLSVDDFDASTLFSIYYSAHNKVNLAFILKQPSTMSVNLMNVMGQTILQNIHKQRLNAGKHSFKIPLEMLSSGVYIAKIKINDHVITKRIFKN